MRTKTRRNILLAFACILTACCFLAGCAKDEPDAGYLSGKFRLDYATVHLDGTTPELTLDNATTLRGDGIASFKFTQREGQRVVVNHSLGDAGSDAINNVSDVLTSRIFAGRLDTLAKDPLKVQSIWVGGGYANMILQVNYFSRNHQFGLYRSTNQPNVLQLRHSKNGDSDGYPIRVYLSFQLSGLQQNADGRTANFTIAVPTAQGLETFNLSYP